jgi:hypothetical protein
MFEGDVHKMRNKMHNNRGAALPLVIITMVVLMILGLAVLNISLADYKHAIYSERKIQANYLARAGADDIGNKIISEKSSTNAIPTLTGTYVDLGEGRKYTVDSMVQLTVTGYTGIVVSVIGEDNGVTSKVGLTITKDKASELLDKAIYSVGDLDISNLDVYGEVASGGDITYQPTKYDTVAYGEPQEGIELNKNFEQLPIADPNLDDHTTLDQTISSETVLETGFRYDTITIDNTASSILVFNTGTVDKAVYKVEIDSTFLSNSGKIKVIGNGILELYVMELFESKGTIEVANTAELEFHVMAGKTLDFQTALSVNAAEDPNKVRIYLDAGSNLLLQANGNYNCYIIGPEANIKMQSDNTVINGAVIGNVFENNNGNIANGVVNFKAPDDSWTPHNAGYNKKFYE